MPRKSLNPEEQMVLSALRDRLVLTLQFMENAQDFPSGEALRQIVATAAAKGDLRTLRLVARDVDAMTVALHVHERDGLEALLAARLGVSKDAERAELKRQIEMILSRGTIASARERRRLEDYVEMLVSTDGDAAEIQRVQQLLRTA